MPIFPKREAEIIALAQNLAAGLAAGVSDFPSPPVSIANLEALLDSAQTAIDNAVGAHGAAEEATSAKHAAFKALIAGMRADLRYAEDAVHYDDAKLTALNWGGKKPRTPQGPPGQPRVLEAPQQGEGWVLLDWKSPSTGGKVASYKIERRECPEGDWMLISVAMATEATLNNQERGKDWEYRVIAVNKAGEGVPNNTVAALV